MDRYESRKMQTLLQLRQYKKYKNENCESHVYYYERNDKLCPISSLRDCESPLAISSPESTLTSASENEDHDDSDWTKLDLKSCLI